MASTASPEASETRRRGRRRLIGAIALVLLLVVFVPMVLDSEPRQARNEPTATIPPRDKAPALPPPAAKVTVPATSPAKPGGPGSEFASVPPGTASRPAEPAPARLTEATPATPAAEASPPITEAAKLQGFAVQVGAFRDEAKLKQSRDKLAAAGVIHYTERLEAKAGPLTRLRAGPFATREQAEAALVKLKRSALDGKVVPLP